MKLKLIFISLIALTSNQIHAAQVSKIRTMASLGAKAAKCIAGAVKAHPYVSLATAASAGYLEYRHGKYARQHATLRREISQLGHIPLDIGALPTEIDVHLPDNTIDKLKIDGTEIYTQSTLGDLIKAQAEKRDLLIIARVMPRAAQAGNNQACYFDADSFNRDFFRFFRRNFRGNLHQHRWGEGLRVGYPLVIQKIGDSRADHIDYYQMPHDRRNIDANFGVQYFIYDYRQPDQGFQYLCTYKKAADGDQFYFYNDTPGSAYYHKSHAELLEIFYTNQSNPETTNQVNIKIAGKMKHYGKDSAEFKSALSIIQETKIARAKEAAKAANRVSLATFIRDGWRSLDREARFVFPFTFAAANLLMPGIGLTMPRMMVNQFKVYDSQGFPFIANTGWNKLIHIKTIEEAFQFGQQEKRGLLKFASYFTGAQIIIGTGICIALWLKVRDAAARQHLPDAQP